jgi:hypothetical protein
MTIFLNLRAKLLCGAAVAALAFAMPPVALPAGAQTPAQTATATKAAAIAANQQNFASPDAAVAALVAALQADDKKALLQIFGPGSEKLVATGDAVADSAAREAFLAAYAQSHTLAPQPDGSVQLIIGTNAWPMPIPLVQTGGHWQFDATTGGQIIIDRQIGRNELLTIQTLLSAVDAEDDYFARMKAANGTGVYAAKLISTPGQHDGLYWDAADGEDPSPLAPLIEQAEDQGYPGGTQSGVQLPYHGYYFHLLKAQGNNAPGGAKTYIQNGKMTGGFAFIAWPAVYGSNGIMTFVVDQDGVVFQKDLGPDTTKTVASIHQFDPDLSWARIDISN